ncbi:MAG: hypothetical protein E8A46_08980 [Bradyrhizobium sp.]|nr:MAG: hypothetical protein E8A46_08980 [Bradyrhizobium sp.]
MIAIGVSIMVLFFVAFGRRKVPHLQCGAKKCRIRPAYFGKMDSQRDPASYDPAIFFSAGEPDSMVQV